MTTELSSFFSKYQKSGSSDIAGALVTVNEHELRLLVDRLETAEAAARAQTIKSALVHYNRFSSYHIDGATLEMATVPDAELRALCEAANLAEAASPKSCNHPADNLEPFNLIVDACVCGECSAVLKYYGPREAAALGIEPGWTKLSAPMLEAEIARAIAPVTDILAYIQAKLSPFSRDHACRVMEWADNVAGRNDSARKLARVRE